VARDVTEKKQQEKAMEALNYSLVEKAIKLKEQEQTIEKIKEINFLSDSIPQIIWTAKPDGKVDYWNQHWYSYTGLNFEQTKGWGWELVLHKDDLQNCTNVWTKSIETGESYEIEYRLKRASDNTYRWHLGRAEPMRDSEGKIVKWYGSCTDIDGYKRMLDLERKLSQFEDFNRMVAHNLRGPAGNIDTLLSLLPNEGSEEEKQIIIDMVKRSSTSLNRTLNELVRVLEVRLSKNIPYQYCNLEEVIKNTENMLEREIAFKKAKIVTNFEVPGISYPLVYLESLFYNLISNALKYCKPGIPPHIRITSVQENNQVMLAFTDEGLGIDLEKHGEDIFKLNNVFHQGYDSKGIGLFMTKNQIETFGGSISVKSRPDVGTEFTVCL
jgi:PAS domain S-box-containing protein